MNRPVVRVCRVSCLDLKKEQTNKKNTTTIRIEKVSTLPPPSPPGQNQAQNHNENSGGISNEASYTSTQLQPSPPENAQNHVQNIDSGDSGDSGGNLPTLQDGMYNNRSNKINFSKRYVAFDFEWSQETSSQLISIHESIGISWKSNVSGVSELPIVFSWSLLISYLNI
jgi:hypothetical protein